MTQQNDDPLARWSPEDRAWLASFVARLGAVERAIPVTFRYRVSPQGESHQWATEDAERASLFRQFKASSNRSNAGLLHALLAQAAPGHPIPKEMEPEDPTPPTDSEQ